MGTNLGDLSSTYITQVIPTAGVLSNFKILANTSPGASKSYAIDVFINGSSAFSCSLTGAEVSDSDAGSVSVAAGDLIYVSVVPTNSPANIVLYYSIMFEGSTAGESILLGTAVAALSTTATRYGVVAGYLSLSATEPETKQIIPTPGTLKKLYWYVSADPGADPDAYRITLRKSGASSALTSVIVANNVSGNDVVNTVAVSAGDDVGIMIEPVDTPTIAPRCGWGMVFVADTNGESLILGGSSGDLVNSAVRYNTLAGQGNAWVVTGIPTMLQPCTLKKLYIELSGSPRANNDNADTYAFEVLLNAGSTGIVATVADGGTGNFVANDTTHTVSATDGQLLTLKCTPASSPTVRDAYWGLVCYIPPVSTYNESLTLAVSADLTRGGVLSAVDALTFSLAAGLSRAGTLSAINALILAVASGQEQAGGMTFEEAVELAVSARKVQGIVASMESGISFGMASDLSPIGQSDIHAGASFGVGAGLTLSVALSMVEACAFGIAVAKAVTGGTVFHEAVVLTINAMEARSATTSMNASLSLGIVAEQRDGTVLSTDAAIALSLAVAMLQTGNVDVGPQTYDEAVEIAVAMGMSLASIGTLREAVTLATAAGMGQAGQSVLVNALVLQATAAMTQASVGTLLASLNLDVSMGEAFGTALILQAAALLGVSSGLDSAGGSEFDESATLGVSAGMAQTLGHLLNAALALNVQVSNAQTATLTAEAQVALSIACDQIDSALSSGIYDVSVVLSILAGMDRWGIVPRIAAAKHLYSALARKREYDALARKREYDATPRKREYDDQ